MLPDEGETKYFNDQTFFMIFQLYFSFFTIVCKEIGSFSVVEEGGGGNWL